MHKILTATEIRFCDDFDLKYMYNENRFVLNISFY